MQNTIEKRNTITVNVDPKRFFPNLLWVLKAVSKDPERLVLNYLNVDNECFCATDGHRLHLYKHLDEKAAKLPEGVTNGVWDVKVLKDSIIFIPIEGSQYPNVKQIIPNYLGEGILENLDVKPKDMSRRLSGCLIDMVKAFNCGVNIEYLKDLSGYSWKVQGERSENTKDKPFHFKNGLREAIVMPLI